MWHGTQLTTKLSLPLLLSTKDTLIINNILHTNLLLFYFIIIGDGDTFNVFKGRATLVILITGIGNKWQRDALAAMAFGNVVVVMAGLPRSR